MEQLLREYMRDDITKDFVTNGVLIYVALFGIIGAFNAIRKGVIVTHEWGIVVPVFICLLSLLVMLGFAMFLDAGSMLTGTSLWLRIPFFIALVMLAFVAYTLTRL